MKYLLLAPIVLIVLFYAIRSSAKSPSSKIADKLYAIRKIYDKDPYYSYKHTKEEYRIYSFKLAGNIIKKFGELQKIASALPDTVAVKTPLMQYIQKWTVEKIGNSLFERDGRFISDNSGLLDYFPYRHKRQWKTLFPIFRA